MSSLSFIISKYSQILLILNIFVDSCLFVFFFALCCLIFFKRHCKNSFITLLVHSSEMDNWHCRNRLHFKLSKQWKQQKKFVIVKHSFITQLFSELNASSEIPKIRWFICNLCWFLVDFVNLKITLIWGFFLKLTFNFLQTVRENYASSRVLHF